MHYHLEVVMPPTDDVPAALAKILHPFDEDLGDDDEDRRLSFWDWYVIGGRWAGAKITHGLNQTQVDAFYAELNKRKVTVSGVQAGKQSLSPESQIEMVDALWRDYFPTCPIRVCPLFAHYKGGMDIITLAETPKDLKVERVIIAGPDYEDKLAADYMTCCDIWNGVNYVTTTWDGTLQSALAAHTEKLARYKPEYAVKRTPRDDWLVVTVDYHS